MAIRRLHDRGGARGRVVHILRIDHERVARRLRSQVIVEIRLARQPAAGGPRRFQRRRRSNRLPRLFGDDADEVLADDHLDEAREVPYGRFVHALERRTDLGRPDDRAVDHSGHAHVVDVFQLRGGHRGQIDTRHRLAEDRPFARLFAFRVRIHRQAESPAAHQLAVGHRLVPIAPDAGDAPIDDDRVARHGEPGRGQIDQRFARGRAGQREVRVVEVRRMRLAARRRSLVRADRRIAHDQLHAIHGHRKLLGNQLGLGGLNALSELAFPRMRRDAAVGGDADPGIEQARVDRRPLRGAAPPLRERERLQGGRAEADDERAGAFEELAAPAVAPSERDELRRGRLGRHAVFSRYLFDRVQHAHVGEAAAQHAGHRLLNLGVGRLGILIEECLRREDDAVQAEPALRRLMLDEGALQRMR